VKQSRTTRAATMTGSKRFSFHSPPKSSKSHAHHSRQHHVVVIVVII
jgi:hypothetical protein